MANTNEIKDINARKIVGAILFSFAGICLVALIAIILMFPDSFSGNNENNQTNSNHNNSASTQVQYKQVDLQDMLNELNANALRAEETYQDMYVEVTGEIKSFDSDGKYISIVPSGTPLLTEWTTCYLTDPSHKTFLLSKNVGDTVTIKGKITSVGEIQGYSIKIAEIGN